MTLIERYYKTRIRPGVFAASEPDAELAHEWGMNKLVRIQNSRFLTALARLFCVYCHPMLETEVMGLQFPNPFGLAAGFDKYCEVYSRAIPACGWGFCEIGGITAFQQSGNLLRPRMKRSHAHQALWNFMGFNNPGAPIAAATMSRHPKAVVPVGLNVGKSKATPLDEAARDYCHTVTVLYQHVDFVTVNPSSPNTPGLRDLQKKTELSDLLRAVKKTMEAIADCNGLPRLPLGVKLSPDLSDEALADCIEVCKEVGAAFITLTNTTVGRAGLNGWDIPADRGGVSGKPLREASERILAQVYLALNGHRPKINLISVGGISNAQELYRRIRLGADLCQAYTAWPFEGPDFARRCLKELVRMLKSDGFRHVSEAVGSETCMCS
jgi:dihydroorotate dehydrogenase